MTTDAATRPEDVAAAVGVPVGALAIRTDQTELDQAQRAALGHIGLASCPDGDVTAFLHLCQRTGLDPWARQIYLIERREQKNGQWISKWQPQTGIDGFRVIAERHPEYRGLTAPEWCGEDGVWQGIWLKSHGKPAAARVGVLRADREEPVWGIAVFEEFAQYRDGGRALTAMWETKSSHMIAKCAEAAGFRRAFPQDMAGLITSDEAAGVDRAARRTRVPSTREQGPVDVAEVTGQPAAAPAPREPKRGPAAGVPNGTPMVTKAQSTHLHALFSDAKVADRDARLRVVSSLADRPLASSNELTRAEAKELIDHLSQLGPDGIAAIADSANRPAAQPDGSDTVDAEVVDEPSDQPAQGTTGGA